MMQKLSSLEGMGDFRGCLSPNLHWLCNWSQFFYKNHRVRLGFGKLWELTMQFSRTWKVSEKGKFIRIGYGRFLEFCLGRLNVYAKIGITVLS